MFRWFESLIPVFPPVDGRMPPRKVLPFYLHYLRPVWPVLLATLIAGLLLALVEVAMFDYLGRIVDMVAEQPGADFFKRHANELGWMLFITVIARPILVGLHNLLVNQAIVPGLSNRSRWLMHNYVVRQSLSFFQNDFAGSVANRVMQTGTSLRESAVQMVDSLWYIVVYTGTALYLFAQADWRLMVPLVLWLLAYAVIMVYFVPRAKERAWIASEARSKAMGRIVDGYTNIPTLKLFAHGGREQAYVAESIQELAVKHRAQTRVTTGMDLTIAIVNGFLIAGTCGLALWLWNGGHITVGAITLATGLVIRIHNMSGWIMWTINGIFEDIGTVQDGITTIAQPLTVQDRGDAVPLQVTRGGVQFQDIHFHYGKKGGVIAGLDLVVKPGEKIGLVGPSGAGKSTLVNVLPGKRPHPDRRPGHRLRHPGKPAPADRRGHPGHFAAASLDPRQPAVRPPRCDRGAAACCRSQGACRGLHRYAGGRAGAPWLRRACRRARREAVRWPAPAHRHCPRAAEGCADPGAGRSDLGTGLGSRSGDPGQPG